MNVLCNCVHSAPDREYMWVLALSTKAQAALRKQAREDKELAEDPDKVWREEQEIEDEKQGAKLKGRGRSGGRGGRGAGKGRGRGRGRGAKEKVVTKDRCSDTADGGATDELDGKGSEVEGDGVIESHDGGSVGHGGIKRKSSKKVFRRSKTTKRRKLLAASAARRAGDLEEGGKAEEASESASQESAPFTRAHQEKVLREKKEKELDEAKDICR